MEFTVEFIQLFFLAIFLAMPLLLFLFFLIVLLGQLVGHIEGWTKFNSLYWSCITAMTVGYGDIRPLKKSSKILSIQIALIGIMFTGIIVAITVNVAGKAFDKHIDVSGALERIENNK